jgi:uncharacterized protein (DUF58 family)
MLSEDLRKKIRQIQIYTSRMVNASFAGQYESVFKGRGMEFDEVREYTPGDDVRSIDWNVTARTGRPHIKRFKEEREMTVMFLVDLSASGDFGTQGRFKNELAAEFCAVLAFAAIRNNDKVGMVIFTDRIELFIPPKKGSKHVLRLIRELLHFEMPGRKTNIPLALDYLIKVLRKKATVFLVSDFIGQDFKKSLSLMNKRHDIIAVNISDPAEIALPAIGLVELYDAETQKTMLVDASSKNFCRQLVIANLQRQENLKQIFRSTGVDNISIATDKPYINDLVKFFHLRHRRA